MRQCCLDLGGQPGEGLKREQEADATQPVAAAPAQLAGPGGQRPVLAGGQYAQPRPGRVAVGRGKRKRTQYRVRVGSYADRKAAESAVRQMASQVDLQTRIVKR